MTNVELALERFFLHRFLLIGVLVRTKSHTLEPETVSKELLMSLSSSINS